MSNIEKFNEDQNTFNIFSALNEHDSKESLLTGGAGSGSGAGRFRRYK